MWYNAPMCDRSKQIIHVLLNGLKNKENEVFVYRKRVKCMFWLMTIPWMICLVLLVILLQRNGASSFKRNLFGFFLSH